MEYRACKFLNVSWMNEQANCFEFVPSLTSMDPKTDSFEVRIRTRAMLVTGLRCNVKKGRSKCLRIRK